MNNRRYFSRIKLQDEICQITVLGKSYVVQLVDQSIGGACIRGLEMLNVIRGLSVEIEMRTEQFKGRILNVFRDGDHRLCYGIAWTENDVPGNRMLLNTFVPNGGDFFVCDFIEFKGDNVLVSLSGEQLEIPRDWIQSFTEGQRETQLQDIQSRNVMEKVYGMPARPSVGKILGIRICRAARTCGQTSCLGRRNDHPSLNLTSRASSIFGDGSILAVFLRRYRR